MKRNRENDFKRDEYEQIVSEVVSRFPHPWLRYRKDDSPHTSRFCYRNGDMKIYFRCGDYGNYGRLAIGGGYPKLGSHTYSPKEPVSISCSADREIDRIVKDIMRRFYYQYIDAFNTCQAKMFLDRAKADKKRVRIQELALSFGGKINESGFHRGIHHYGQLVQRGVICASYSDFSDGDKITIEIDRVGFDLGLELLRACDMIIKAHKLKGEEIKLDC